ncbi:hypothetical protein SCHPADRAFT_914776 [Schizopora paradoxa]|uniref:P-loop containing nucleoside triphosphate hydrolase protein n=1 Tax=Schizopora paradoxa TaxID=27342 RepID=A0A0H2RYL2_9AGAM|nr:hypothetical protein SCHPADRAFT_914776 [Schizopora paradoxa]
MAPNSAPLVALFVVRLVFSTILLATSLSLFTLTPSPYEPLSGVTPVVVAVKTPRRSLILALLYLIALAYFLDGFALILHSVLSKSWQGTPGSNWWASQWSGLEVETLFGLLSSALLAILGSWKEAVGLPVWTMKRPKAWAFIAAVGGVVEVSLLFSTVHFASKLPRTQFRIPDVLHTLFPTLRLLFTIPLYAALLYPHVKFVPAPDAAREADEGAILPAVEETALLDPQEDEDAEDRDLGLGTSKKTSKYGTFGTSGLSIPSTTTQTRSTSRNSGRGQTGEQRLDSAVIYNQSWSEFFARLRKFLPYLWPAKSSSLQFVAVLCLLILFVGRFVNVALPFTLGKLVKIFEGSEAQSFWPFLLAYVVLRFLSGSGGLSSMIDTLWTPVSQYSDREMSFLAFDHLLSLSLNFHTQRKTGEVLRILDRGQAINRVFELLLFSVSPAILDIIFAIVVFAWKFDWVLAVVVGIVMIMLTQWRTQIRRRMNDKDIVVRGIHTDCLLNYETVKYFGGEDYERSRYTSAINDYQTLEYKVITSLNVLRVLQALIAALGYLVGGMIVALRVTSGKDETADFVIFVAYLAQLFSPLDKLATVYRQINTSLIDAERLLKLLDEPVEVKDRPDASDLLISEGEIEFDDVSFSYDGRRTALSHVSFKVPKGSSVALVGESGSGKSTILRLLYRFYDLHEGEGRILIDGQDIRDVTQASLRNAIGVIPQEPILFNSSILYNISYGKIGSSRDEVESAARAAQIHDRVVSLPDDYDTKVGERGVRLSGGEKQRVAIARALLKNPPILLLDEATSALDTSTEKDIQKALQNLVEGRSSLSIAHRLSTIASADLILVLKDERNAQNSSDEAPHPYAEQIAKDAESYPIAPEDGPTTESDALVESAAPDQSDITGEEVDKPAQEDVVTAEIVEEQAAEVQATEEQVPSADESDKKSYAEVVASEGPSETKEVEDTVIAEADQDPPKAQASDAPIAFPSYDADTTEPFPAPPQSPGVTFDASTQIPTPRSGTPDPSSEPKRKRTASQNFQKFARRVSLVARRSGSSTSIPVPAKKDAQSKEATDDGSSTPQAEGSLRGESPASSIQGEDGKRGKKDKKAKKRFSLK